MQGLLRSWKYAPVEFYGAENILDGYSGKVILGFDGVAGVLGV